MSYRLIQVFRVIQFFLFLFQMRKCWNKDILDRKSFFEFIFFNKAKQFGNFFWGQYVIESIIGHLDLSRSFKNFAFCDVKLFEKTFHIFFFFNDYFFEFCDSGDFLKGELKIENHFFSPLLHIWSQGSIFNIIWVKKISLLLHCFHDILLKIWDHYFR